jgi:GNAT superfamily N-acetyltransferase
MDVIIRKGTEKEIGDLYRLICELAIYERAPNDVIVNTEILLRDFQKGDFIYWVADFEGEIVGIALCYLRYSTWKGRCLYLEDFIISEKARRKGLGQKLWNVVIEYAQMGDYFSLNWQVLDWNEPALEFYRKQKAELDAQWVNGRIILGK